MKSFLVFILTIIYCNYAVCQQRLSALYGEFGGGYGSHGSIKGAISAVIYGNNIITVCYVFSSHMSPNIPADYIPGGMGGIFGRDIPHQNMEAHGLMLGKVLFSNNSILRVTLKGGFSVVNINTPMDFKPNQSVNTSFLSSNSNYTYVVKSTSVSGILLNPTLEMPFSKELGLSLGLYSNINVVNSVYGIEVSLIFGKVRDNLPF
jgi:hypothetical protein